MNNREKLIELLQNWGNKENDGVRAESIADYLLENGVIVLSVKVGQTVYYIGGIYNGIRPIRIGTIEGKAGDEEWQLVN